MPGFWTKGVALLTGVAAKRAEQQQPDTTGASPNATKSPAIPAVPAVATAVQPPPVLTQTESAAHAREQAKVESYSSVGFHHHSLSLLTFRRNA